MMIKVAQRPAIMGVWRRTVSVAVNWQPLIEFVLSVRYGVLSSLVPIFNSEPYIVASQVGGFTAEVTTAVGCAIGQTIGKVESSWSSDHVLLSAVACLTG